MPLAAQSGAQSGMQRGQDAAARAQRAQRTNAAAMQNPVRGAEFFLARTGELGLTDQQVVQLAAIARRAEARRQAQRQSMPAMNMARGAGMRGQPGAPADSAARAARMQGMQQMRANMTAMREAREADLRDAIAVLTPEQQARAWSARGNRRGGRR